MQLLHASQAVHLRRYGSGTTPMQIEEDIKKLL